MSTRLRVFILSLCFVATLLANGWYASPLALAQQESSEWSEEEEPLTEEEELEGEGEQPDESGVPETVRGTGGGGICPEPCLPPD